MILGILQCGRISESLAADHGSYPQMYAALFDPIYPKIQYLVFDVEQGCLPEDVDRADAYLISGSPHGVNDNLPWIEPLASFVRLLYRAKKKVIGICFGHQLIAHSLGGKVIKSPKGWGVGVSTNKILHLKSWMTPRVQQLNLIVSHQDQVIELPPEAEVLASNPLCPYYMLQFGHHFLTIQGHPEYTKAYSKASLSARKERLTTQEFTGGIGSLSLPIDNLIAAQWIATFLQQDESGF